MSHYDELRENFSKYQLVAREASLKYLSLLAALAHGFQSFLGAPKSFVDSRSGIQRLYVTPIGITRRDGHFVVGKTIPTGIDPHHDGRFYFGLCTYLEAAEKEHPKRPFCVLLSAAMHADDIEIRVEDTEPKFSVHLNDPDGLKDLYGEILSVIQDTLDGDFDGPKPHIGFIEDSI